MPPCPLAPMLFYLYALTKEDIAMSFNLPTKLLRVDLSAGRWTVQELEEREVRVYLGGSGIAARILYDEDVAGGAPNATESPLLFMPGLLTGTPVPTACKLSVCARSPLTGIWGEATAGGHCGAEFARTGYAGVAVRGRADAPVYLWIRDDRVEIRSASTVWGKDTYETEEVLRGETDARAKVACIGPAGERGLPIASVMFEGRHARAAGRAGMGAVMGAKHLKAIVVRGTGRRTVFDPDGLRAEVKACIPEIKARAKGLSDFGTAGSVESVELHGDLPIQNWRLGTWTEGARRTSGQAMASTMFRRHYACFGCPIACGKRMKIEGGPHAGLDAHGPEYETAAGFGALCLNDDPEAIVVANDLCARYGLDTISTSAAIAFAMEAYEKGILSREDADGLDLTWGDADAMLELIHRIGRGEGIGELLGGGVRRAADALGHNAVEFAIHVKGLELPYHDPRAFVDMAVNYATANRGGCHMASYSYVLGYGVSLPEFGYTGEIDPHDHEGKAEMAVRLQNLMTVYDALGLCKFLLRTSVGPVRLAAWLHHATGWPEDPDELMETGERIFTLKRMYNVRLGISRKDDLLPPRLLTLDRETGAAAGSLPHLGRLLSEYYALRGWGEDGVPSEER